MHHSFFKENDGQIQFSKGRTREVLERFRRSNGTDDNLNDIH